MMTARPLLVLLLATLTATTAATTTTATAASTTAGAASTTMAGTTTAPEGNTGYATSTPATLYKYIYSHGHDGYTCTGTLHNESTSLICTPNVAVVEFTPSLMKIAAMALEFQAVNAANGDTLEAFVNTAGPGDTEVWTPFQSTTFNTTVANVSPLHTHAFGFNSHNIKLKFIANATTAIVMDDIRVVVNAVPRDENSHLGILYPTGFGVVGAAVPAVTADGGVVLNGSDYELTFTVPEHVVGKMYDMRVTTYLEAGEAGAYMDTISMDYYWTGTEKDSILAGHSINREHTTHSVQTEWFRVTTHRHENVTLTVVVRVEPTSDVATNFTLSASHVAYIAAGPAPTEDSGMDKGLAVGLISGLAALALVAMVIAGYTSCNRGHKGYAPVQYALANGGNP